MTQLPRFDQIKLVNPCKSNILLFWALIGFVAVLFTSAAFGHSWDEALYFEGARAAANWLKNIFTSFDTSLFSANRICAYWGEKFDGNDPLHPEVAPIPKILTGIGTLFVNNDESPIFAMRFPIAVIYCLTLLLLGYCSKKMMNSISPVIFYLFMPRVFAHAHIAASETICAFVVISTLSYYIFYLRKKLNYIRATVLGILLALSFLTKITLIPIFLPLLICLILKYRKHSLLPLIISGIICILAIYVFWPVLWHAPISQFLSYVSFYFKHQSTAVFFLGQKWGYTFGPPAPWYYAIVITLIVIPAVFIPFLLLGLFMSITRRKHHMLHLVVACSLIPIILTMLPSAPKYDGERLFFSSFILFSIVMGYGWKLLLIYLKRLSLRISYAKLRFIFVSIVCLVLIGCASSTFLNSPFQMDHYNLLVGGSPGARRLGFETTYWGQTVNKEVIKEINSQLPKGACLVPLSMEALSLDHLKSWHMINDDITIESGNGQRFYLLQSRQGFWGNFEQRLHFTKKPIYAYKDRYGTSYLELFSD